MTKSQIKLIIGAKIWLTIIFTLMKVAPNGWFKNLSWIWIAVPIWLPVLILFVYRLIVWLATTEWIGTVHPDDENF